MTSSTDKDFETSLVKLEQIVRELESGDVGLTQSLSRFEEGIQLYKKCRQTLEAAEKKVKILSDSLKEIDYQE
jgi:exodeoxyribonuclease VII small subunit